MYVSSSQLYKRSSLTLAAVIDGSRIDDMQYLADHNIDRNQVAQQLSHLFTRMIYITGFFHAYV
jgi:aarF domain-containing kinase